MQITNHIFNIESFEIDKQVRIDKSLYHRAHSLSQLTE